MYFQIVLGAHKTSSRSDPSTRYERALRSVLANALERRTLWASLTAPRYGRSSTASSGAAAAASAAVAGNVSKPAILTTLEHIVSMGFPVTIARFALNSARGNLDEALNLIISGAIYDEVGDDAEDAAVANQRWEALLRRLNVFEQCQAWQSQQQNLLKSGMFTFGTLLYRQYD